MKAKQNDNLTTENEGKAQKEIVIKESHSIKFNFWKWKAKYFAWSYILCVPIFALIYAQIPNDFYHTTVKYEQEYQELIGSFGNQLSYESSVLGKLTPTLLQSEHDASILQEYEDYVDTYCQIGLINNFEVIGKQLKFDAIIETKQYLKKDLSNKYKAPFKIDFLTKARLSIDFSKDSESKIEVSADIKSKANELLNKKR